jgi:hypothetical protein
VQQAQQQPQPTMLNQNGYAAYQTATVPSQYQQATNYAHQYQMAAMISQNHQQQQQQEQQQQQQQQQSQQPQQQQSKQSTQLIVPEKLTIKMEPIEPMEPSISTHPHYTHTNGDNNQHKNVSDQISYPYFTNPVAFKQEPIEPTVQQNSNLSANTTPEQSFSSHSAVAPNESDNSEKDALTLVNKLLKDKQILNQLEKVAQSFKHPTSSMYQDNWSFQAQQPSSKSSTSSS